MTKHSWCFAQVPSAVRGTNKPARRDGTRLVLCRSFDRFAPDMRESQRCEPLNGRHPMKALMATAAAVALLAGIATANAQNAPAKTDKSQGMQQSMGAGASDDQKMMK